jgi:hypothetical protein
MGTTPFHKKVFRIRLCYLVKCWRTKICRSCRKELVLFISAYWRSQYYYKIMKNTSFSPSLWSRSQWPNGLRWGSTCVRVLELWVRIPLWAWMFVSCECLCVVR